MEMHRSACTYADVPFATKNRGMRKASLGKGQELGRLRAEHCV